MGTVENELYGDYMNKEVPENGRLAFAQGWDETANPFKTDPIKAARWTADWWSTNANTLESNCRSSDQPATKEELLVFLSMVKDWLKCHGGTGDYIILCPMEKLAAPGMDQAFGTYFLTTVDKMAACDVMTSIMQTIKSGGNNDLFKKFN